MTRDKTAPIKTLEKVVEAANAKNALQCIFFVAMFGALIVLDNLFGPTYAIAFLLLTIATLLFLVLRISSTLKQLQCPNCKSKIGRCIERGLLSKRYYLTRGIRGCPDCDMDWTQASDVTIDTNLPRVYSNPTIRYGLANTRWFWWILFSPVILFVYFQLDIATGPLGKAIWIAQGNRNVQSKLGDPVHHGYSIWEDTTTNNERSFRITMTGSKGSGYLSGRANWQGEQWEISELKITSPDKGEIDLKESISSIEIR